MLAGRFCFSEHLGSMLEDVGSKMRQEGDQEDQIEPRMGDWKLPDGKCRGGWKVNELLLGPTIYSSLLAANL